MLFKLVKFFRLDYIDSICLVKWQGLVKLVNLVMLISNVRIVMLLRLDKLG